MSVVGVDACKAGWVAVELCDGAPPKAHFLRHIREIADAAPEASVVAIDIPIGLPDGGRRPCDEGAKDVLGPRRNSVFFTPPRAALLAASHADATRLSSELTGFGLSRQSYGLAARILEVEGWLPTAGDRRVIEVHPEVCFTEMLGHPAAASKKTWAGMIDRGTALASVGIDMTGVGGPAGERAAIDDMLDAAAAAWTARRAADGEAYSIPTDAPTQDGRPVAIWV